MTSHDPSVRR